MSKSSMTTSQILETTRKLVEIARNNARAKALREVEEAIFEEVRIADDSDLGREEGFHSPNALGRVLALFDSPGGKFEVKE